MTLFRLSLAPPTFACLLLLTVLLHAPLAAAEDLGLKAPPGFVVTLLAGDDMAHDIYSMTIDSHGEVVVSGPGYVKTLHDRDGDGHAEAATVFSTLPAAGAHGMVFDGDDLICCGDNSVMRQRDADHDGRADGPPEIWAKLKNSEHGANGLVQGPDGCFYLVCGNDAGVSTELVREAASPIKLPHCGAIVRFSAEGKPLDVLADGFRNPYDIDFSAAGGLFTVDSDNERDHRLPWYTPTRLFDIAQGRGHGWVFHGFKQTWNRPASYFDNVGRVAELGRGSPTGLVVYRHRQFPSHYQGAVLSACWTLGRVYALPLESAGATYHSTPEIFIETTGSVGFAPCDLAVGPAGDLFIAIGGRRTRGSVFRVRYVGSTEGPSADAPPIQTPSLPTRPTEGPSAERPSAVVIANAAAEPVLSVARLRSILDAPQPLAAWSRTLWKQSVRSLDAGAEGFQGAKEFLSAAGNARLSVGERMRTVEILVECFDGVPSAEAAKLAQAAPPEVVARLAWALSRRPLDGGGRQFLTGLTCSDEPRVCLAAWEALATAEPGAANGDSQDFDALSWPKALANPDRRLRSAAMLLAGRAGAASFDHYLAARGDERSTAERLAALEVKYLVSGAALEKPDAGFWSQCAALFAAAETPGLKLEALRLVHLGLGDMPIDLRKGAAVEAFFAYSAAHLDYISESDRERLEGWLAAALAAGGPDAELDRETARLAAVLELKSPAALDAVASHWTDSSSPKDDVHYLIVAARLTAERSDDATRRIAKALIDLDRKLAARGEMPGGNWGKRVGEVFDELCRRDPRLPAALVDEPAFGALPHALFVSRLTDHAIRQRAIERMLDRAKRDDDRPSPELIELVGELTTDQARDWLREQADDVGLADPVARALATHPMAEDRPRFIAALGSMQAVVAQSAARALAKLPGDATPPDLGAALEALRRGSSDRSQADLAKAADALLTKWSGAPGNAPSSSLEDLKSAYARWSAWFSEKYPAEAQAIASRAVKGGPEWNARLASIDWTGGDATRGRAVFERRACQRCHLAAGQLGPELRGAVTRMARDDLFAAIIDPNREISPTFASTMFITANGQVVQGMIAYDSPESIIVQTGPDTTVRITDTAGLVQTPSRTSLMPEGLLNGASDAELADLFAYMQTLAKPAAKAPQ